MMHLELLAPARTLDIGIAAIDCGADAVYIAAGEFGARQDAGNSIEDIAELCRYAHRFGARIFVTVNTILFDDELSRAGDLIAAVAEAGTDALIVQDPAVLALARERGVDIPMHASTQCSIRTPGRARFLESLGFSRLVLERALTLDDVRAIRSAVEAEIEFFVHGAVCVCYNGQCYLSEALEGRSANRGRCIQACRSRYDLLDGSGKVIVKDKTLLSLKDMNLLDRLEDLAEAGVCSFKIEGRLKNKSYVMNTVRAYSEALDRLCQARPDRWARASFGRSEAGFVPDLNKTFNRGYTSLFLDGRQEGLCSMEIAKSTGERIGMVTDIRPAGKAVRIAIRPTTSSIRLANGDGFCFAGPDGEVTGFRGDVCEGFTILSKPVPTLRRGDVLYRNIDAAFEKQLRAAKVVRRLSVDLEVMLTEEHIAVTASTEDGRKASSTLPISGETALDGTRMESVIRNQLGKGSGIYSFRCGEIRNRRSDGSFPLLGASSLNGIRRDLAAILDTIPCNRIPLKDATAGKENAPGHITYKDNVANRLTEDLYRSRGASDIGKAYEVEHGEGAELMRSRYCIRYELGLCPVRQGAPESGPLFLRNNGRLLRLGFDCKACEMTVSVR